MSFFFVFMSLLLFCIASHAHHSSAVLSLICLLLWPHPCWTSVVLAVPVPPPPGVNIEEHIQIRQEEKRQRVNRRHRLEEGRGMPLTWLRPRINESTSILCVTQTSYILQHYDLQIIPVFLIWCQGWVIYLIFTNAFYLFVSVRAETMVFFSCLSNLNFTRKRVCNLMSLNYLNIIDLCEYV